MAENCPYYEEAPICQNGCGSHTLVVSLHQRMCETCWEIIELTPKEKEKVLFLKSKGFNFPDSFEDSQDQYYLKNGVVLNKIPYFEYPSDIISEKGVIDPKNVEITTFYEGGSPVIKMKFPFPPTERLLEKLREKGTLVYVAKYDYYLLRTAN